MRKKRKVPYRRLALLVVLSLAAAGTLAGQGAVPNKEQTDDAAALKRFTVRVDQYVKFRNTIEKQLPALKNKE